MGLSECSVEALLAVSDLDRARRFYERQLGLVPGDEEEQAVRYPCAGETRILIYLSPENAGKSPATLAGWDVDDLDQTMDELASRGVVFEQYDQPGSRPTSAACSMPAASGPPGSRTPTATRWRSPRTLSLRALGRPGRTGEKHGDDRKRPGNGHQVGVLGDPGPST